jgi:anthranilate phosphoribosyltransferase
MSIDLDIRRELEDFLQGQSPLGEIVPLLKDYRSRGVTQDELLAMLEAMRRNAPSEEREDRILEVMDVVSGFCRAEFAIWNREKTG